jgi:hypothetical protein
LKQNNNTALTRLRMLVPLAISFVLLPACSMNPFGSEQADSGEQGRIITVSSNPSGATIKANGRKLGETPLKVNIDKSFPHIWVPSEGYGIVYRVSGELSIEKSGCKDYTVPVSHIAPAGDINVTLVCTEALPAPAPAETVKPAEAVKPVISESIKQRLEKLDKLHRDGVISTDEYNQHRSRILGEL